VRPRDRSDDETFRQFVAATATPLGRLAYLLCGDRHLAEDLVQTCLIKPHGPPAGLALLDELDDDPHLAHHHRLAAVRAHLLEMAGNVGAARKYYEQAARTTASATERNYLLSRLSRL
jgi:hypothetical protein